MAWTDDEKEVAKGLHNCWDNEYFEESGYHRAWMKQDWDNSESVPFLYAKTAHDLIEKYGKDLVLSFMQDLDLIH